MPNKETLTTDQPRDSGVGRNTIFNFTESNHTRSAEEFEDHQQNETTLDTNMSEDKQDYRITVLGEDNFVTWKWQIGSSSV